MKDGNFEYKYSALTEEERAETEYIRSQYLEKNEKEEKLDKLRSLDGKVKNIPTIFGLVLGIIGTLIFGLGIAMILEWNITIWGVVVGIIGLCVAGIAYFIYEYVRSYLINKYSEEIIDISNELLNEDKEQ